MRIGLYLDLAVGSDSHGADPWADPELYAANVSIGAPPDDFNLEGQVWGLPPWTPRVLRERAYAPFVDVLRANMRHAGALRIDHVLGLLRLFWVPSGRDSGHGAYVRYPLRDLLAITALESARENCVVVGEDLGTTPDELRAALAEYGLLSYRVLYFERHWHAEELFRASFDYPRDALVTVSTHDLATFAGFWTAHDLELRRELDLYPDVETAAEHRAARDLDRRRLLGALEYEDLRPPQGDEHGVEAPSWELVLAVHRFLARTPAALLSVQMEDVLGQREQANVPGTVQQYPNWRRKLSLPVEDWAEHEPLRELAEAVRQERSKNQKGT
jgi:(1->4)-alpha-D-glucan 1-alpha-D-glucosylmutase